MIAQVDKDEDMTGVITADDARHIGRGTLSYGFMRAVTIPRDWFPVSYAVLDKDDLHQ